MNITRKCPTCGFLTLDDVGRCRSSKPCQHGWPVVEPRTDFFTPTSPFVFGLDGAPQGHPTITIEIPSATINGLGAFMSHIVAANKNHKP